ncbi:MAG: hypothetical protein ACRC5T_04060 [Cetobacterium sp.]
MDYMIIFSIVITIYQFCDWFCSYLEECGETGNKENLVYFLFVNLFLILGVVGYILLGIQFLKEII